MHCDGHLVRCSAELNFIGEKKTAVLQQFMDYCVVSDINDPLPTDTFEQLKAHSPRRIWGQVSEDFPDLAPILIDVFSLPTGAVGGERNHKAMKKVHNSARNRLGGTKVSRQTKVMIVQFEAVEAE